MGRVIGVFAHSFVVSRGGGWIGLAACVESSPFGQTTDALPNLNRNRATSFADSTMGGFLYRGEGWASDGGSLGGRTITKVGNTKFCDLGRCPRLAVWSLGINRQNVDFCREHTLAAMRKRERWLS